MRDYTASSAVHAFHGKKAGRYFIHEPDAVLAPIKYVTGMVHRIRVHFEYHWLTVPCPNPMRGFCIRGEMHMMAIHLAQAALKNRYYASRACAMIQDRGRRNRRQFQFDFNGMPLTCPNPCAVLGKGEPLLVVFSDHSVEFGTGDSHIVAGARGEQIGNRTPTSGIEYQPDSLWVVSEMPREILTDLN